MLARVASLTDSSISRTLSRLPIPGRTKILLVFGKRTVGMLIEIIAGHCALLAFLAEVLIMRVVVHRGITVDQMASKCYRNRSPIKGKLWKQVVVKYTGNRAKDLT